jgi:indole-3-glycerol phosphate synthase
MPVSLDDIMAAARRRAEHLRRAADVRALEQRAGRHKPRGFRAALARAAQNAPAVIAELKKASPSKGVLRGTFPVGRIASQFEHGGAAALSVLTDEDFFQGSLANLCEASAATRLPCLRKDFIVDELQLLESRANAADAVLLIVKVLTDAQLRALLQQARAAQLDVLCEVHDETELQRALAAGADTIGVNSRDLSTFQTDLEVLRRLIKAVPHNVVRVAESGIATGEELRALRQDGYQAFLVGESLMRAEAPGEALLQMLAQAKAPAVGAVGVYSWKSGTKD